MEQVLAVPFNFSHRNVSFFKYISQRTGIVFKPIAIPVLSGIAYAERYMDTGRFFICDADQTFIQYAIIEKRQNSNFLYEVKLVSGFKTDLFIIDHDSSPYSIENIISTNSNCGKLSEYNLDKVVLCGPLNEKTACLLIAFKKIFGIKVDSWTEKIPASEVGSQIMQRSFSNFSLGSIYINDVITNKLSIFINNYHNEIINEIIIDANTPLPAEATKEIDLTTYNNGLNDNKSLTIHLMECFTLDDNDCIYSTQLDFTPSVLSLTIKIDLFRNIILMIEDKQKKMKITVNL